MAKNDNLNDFLKDIANAIREKTEDSGLINAQNFADKIRNLSTGSTGSGWTGHADVEGLKAIGWTDEDIAYYQIYGVNWDEEYDDYHKVTDDNKELYKVLTADNISTYKDRIVYLPKMNIDNYYGVTGANFFSYCTKLVALPMIDTSSFTSFYNMFYGCGMLTCVPPLNTSSVTNMDYAFYDCHSLLHISDLDTSKVTTMSNMIRNCYCLKRFPNFDMSQVNKVDYLVLFCYSLQELKIDLASLSNAKDYFRDNYSLTQARIKNIKLSISLSKSNAISKESLLYLINNEAATSAITITLASNAYTRLANDPDIVAALANHPNISIAQ